jgi:hypothetical protein
VEGVALAGPQSLSPRQIGNIIKNVSKEKREELKRKLEAGNSPDNSNMVHILSPPKVLDTQTLWRSPKEKETTYCLRRQFK